MTGAGILTAICVVLYFVARIAQLGGRTSGQLREAESRLAAGHRLAKGTPDLRDGEVVTLVGTVQAPKEPLVGPVSGRPCVFYAATARTWEREGRKMRLVDELAASGLVPFRLATPRGEILVDGDRAETSLPTLAVIPRRLEREADFLRAHDRDERYLASVSCEECIVAAGDRIAVSGMIVIERDEAPEGYRDEKVRIRIVEHAAHPLTIGKAR